MVSIILAWSFISMGLVGFTVLFPLLGAMFSPPWMTSKIGIAAAVSGPLVDILWKVAYPKGMDPLYPGLAVSLSVLLVVSIFTKEKVVVNTD